MSALSQLMCCRHSLIPPTVCRHHTVDCERATTEEAILAARQNSIAVPFEVKEYEVHGEFKQAKESRPFPDTHWFTIRELHQGGLPKAAIQEAMLTYDDCNTRKDVEDMHDIPSEDEEVEKEGEEAGEEGEEDEQPIGGGGGGRGRRRVVGEEDDVGDPPPPPWRFR